MTRLSFGALVYMTAQRSCGRARWSGALCLVASTLAAAFLAGPQTVHAAADPGGLCNALDMLQYRQATTHLPRSNFRVWVARQDAPVFDAPDGREVDNLPFSDVLYGVDLLDVAARSTARPLLVDWMQVARFSATPEQALGWMRTEDLLCGRTPMKANNGLDRKAFIRTQLAARGESQPVQAYRSPTQRVCHNDCRQLSRFMPYFVAAETPDRLLLVDAYLRDERTGLVGWVDKRDIIPWNTALGVRPRADLERSAVEGGGAGAICAYADPAQYGQAAFCRPVVGGNVWFRSRFRMALLDEEDGFYRVAVSSSGTGEGRYSVDPENWQLIDHAAGAGSNQVDVFFLIDGTESMTEVIDVIRGGPGRPGIIDRIADALAEKVSRGATLRFGFRVYRDSVAAFSGRPASTGIDEGLALPDIDCERPTELAISRNHDAFRNGIRGVTARAVKPPPGVLEDYAENTFGGLLQALRDIAGCSDNTKVVFVIGDHGYDASRQRGRGFRPVTVDQIIERMRGRFRVPPVVVFLQTPRNHSGITRATGIRDYDEDYDGFARQAREILSQLYGNLSEVEREKMFERLPVGGVSQTVVDRVVDNVHGFVQPHLIEQVRISLRGGASLVEAIERLQGSSDDAPILFWDMVRDRLCVELGPQCRETVFEAVNELYMKADNDVDVDVWLRQGEMETWKQVLRPLTDPSLMSSSDTREAVTNALISSLQETVNIPPPRNTGEPLYIYLERVGGLPNRARSPLMSYSIDELNSRTLVPDCEIAHLQSWIRSAAAMLSIVSQGTSRPVYRVEDWANPCPMSENGLLVPSIYAPRIRPAPLGPTPEYSYQHEWPQTVIYWVPQKYLP